MVNNVRKARERAGLTQAALAKRVGTSQQQIHRIEAGQTTRLQLTLQLAAALDTTVEALFPAARSALRRLTRVAPDERRGLLDERETQDVLEQAGIDADPLQWILAIHLLTGPRRLYWVDSREKARIWAVIQRFADADATAFFTIDAAEQVVVVNHDAVAAIHFLWEAPSDPPPADAGVTVFLMGQAAPLELDVDADPEPPEEAEGGDDEGQLRGVCFLLETNPGPREVVHIEDGDGEVIAIRVGAIALLEIPRGLIEAGDHEAGAGDDAAEADDAE